MPLNSLKGMRSRNPRSRSHRRCGPRTATSQQLIADGFARLGLIAKPVNVSDIVWRSSPGCRGLFIAGRARKPPAARVNSARIDLAGAFSSESLPGLDAGWIPVRVKKTRQNKNPEPRSDSIGTEKALADQISALRAGRNGCRSEFVD